LNMYVVPLEKAGYTVNVYEHRRDADERTVKATSKEGNNSNKKISPDDIKLGDVFLYRGEEVTVSSMLGIYPDDVGISKKEKLSNGMEYEITENVDKYRLTDEGKYLGNIDEKQTEKVKEEKTEGKKEETITPVEGKDITNNSEITDAVYQQEKASTFFVNGGGILTIPLNVSDELFQRLADAGLKRNENSVDEIMFETDKRSWNKIYIPDKWGNKTNNIDIDKVMSESEIKTSKLITEKIMPDKKKVKSENFRITDDKLGEWTPKNKYKYNVEAIKILKQIENEDRQATPEEQEILSKYVGWGGLPDVFDERKGNWSKEYAELKELLNDDEYTATRSSTLNAHYTSPLVIKSIYKALENMGFNGGKILEPSMGVGNFFGMLPEKMKNDTKLYGVELDSITGRVAKQLYPNANIQVKGFEKTTFKNNYFDVAVGNVPFGNYRVHDENFKSNDLIHDYFIKKSLEKVKPNGVIAFVTSKGTMDKLDNSVRKYLAERAELLGAVRLPQTAFQKNAGTEVTTDILFLQKRENVRDFSVEEIPDWVNISEDKNGIAVNNYFIEKPDMILGEMQLVSSQFGMESACVPFDDVDFGELLNDAVLKIKGHIPQSIEIDEEEIKQDISNEINPDNYRNYCFCVINDDIYFRENDVMQKQSFDKSKAARIKGMIGISEALRELITYQLENRPDDVIKAQQKKLNYLYDVFTAKYGLLSDKANHPIFRQDDTSELLVALEKIDDKGKFAGKADIFTKRTIVPYIPVDKVDTASEALAVSISEKAKIDLEYMSELCSKSKEEIIEDLKGIIFENPETCRFETSDEYLSGNVRKKLEIAKSYAENDEKYNINVSSLEAVQPVDLKPSEISAQLCSTWIPTKYFEQFMYELLDTPKKCRSDYFLRNNGNDPFSSGKDADSSTIIISYDEKTSTYGISNKSNYKADRYNIKANQTYGTKRMNAYKIIEATLNMQPVKICDYIEDENGKKKAVLNKKETLLAQEKQNIIKQRFKEWIFDDFDRAADLCKIYNERFNSVRPREYDGSHLTFGGMNPEITLRPHQRDAIAHAIYGKNTLFAHTVGAGKSYEICATAMESKRLGLCNKSLIVVPKHIVNQFAKEFLQLYPTANILVPDEKDFSKANRKKFCSRIATGNYDAIIISHTQLEKIPLSPERQEEYINKQISDITKSLDEMRKEQGKNGFSIKQLESMQKNLEVKLEKLNNDSKRDTTITFEELGIDRLFVDEVHLYKNRAKRFRIR
ncbi:MAG: DEAD/DEAH box helicase family protein, partial [Firmicutes bacterium]|nr:DEAD/DEAH box helicase family protein [Bacillota bacterium]